MRLLLVEDDELLGNGIEAGLKQAGYAVDWAKDGREAQLALDTTQYELLVLDLGLPRVAGMDVLQQLRRKGSDVPVLLLTARDTVRDRVAGLEAGADDYLVKPFDLAELVARKVEIVSVGPDRDQTVVVDDEHIAAATLAES